jgi:CheY-like chemotaxis protein
MRGELVRRRTRLQNSAHQNGAPAHAAMAATRVLFVGNSLTYWRPGLDALFRGWGFDAAAVTEGGATLQVLWDAGTALKAIRSGQYGFVVLQDDMPEYGGAAAASKFQKYTRHFVEAVRESAAVPILLLTHSYDRMKHTRLHAIASAHQEAARALDVTVAPSGLVIGREGLSAASRLGALLCRDKEHPLPVGMLLTALVVRAAMADACGDARAASAERLQELALNAIQTGALSGAALPEAAPEALAATLASLVQAGRQWWRTFPEDASDVTAS